MGFSWAALKTHTVLVVGAAPEHTAAQSQGELIFPRFAAVAAVWCSVEQVVMQVLALPSDRSVSELAPLLADWDAPKFLALLRSLAGQATAARCVAGSQVAL